MENNADLSESINNDDKKIIQNNQNGFEREPSDYKYVYKNSSSRAILSFLGFGALSIAFSIATYYSSDSVGTSIFFIICTFLFILASFAGLKKLIDKAPKLKLSSKGFWTPKCGFIDWNNVKNEINYDITRSRGMITSMILKIHLIDPSLTNNKQSPIVIYLEDLENREKIVSIIDYLRITTSNEVENTNTETEHPITKMDSLEHVIETSKINTTEPKEYLHTFYIDEEQAKKMLMFSIPTTLISSYLTYACITSEDIDARLMGICIGIALVGMIFICVGCRDFFDKNPKIKLSNDGFWTKKYGFVNWNNMIDMVIHKGNYNSTILKIYLKENVNTNGQLPLVEIGISGLKDGDKIVPFIEAYKISRNINS